MKLTKLITMCALSSVLTSCTITCYQVFSTKPTTENIVVKDKSMLYSDDVCAISYNLWCNGGDPGFLVFNKTNEKLYLNLKESFFTLNGIAYDYYEKGSSFSAYSHTRTKATTKSISDIERKAFAIIKVGQISSNIKSDSYSEMHIVGSQTANIDIVCIPPHSSKPIAKFAIASQPLHKSTKEVKYSKTDTPLKFANYISYYTESNKEKPTLVKNEFYVDKTSNILYSIKKDNKPNEFFITYDIRWSENPTKQEKKELQATAKQEKQTHQAIIKQEDQNRLRIESLAIEKSKRAEKVEKCLENNLRNLRYLTIDVPANSYTQLGDNYFYGKEGKEFNIAKAFLCYNIGAKQGEAEAFLHIALYYETGKSHERFFLEKDLGLALGFYEKAESLNVQGASERIKMLQQSR